MLIEQVLRHRPMQRPPSPGCFHGGLPRPQWLAGAAQPFSKWSPEKLIELTGSAPIYKLHGTLNWSLSGDTLVTNQDMRAVFRGGGNAAIVPPVPEKTVPGWLATVCHDAELAARKCDIWIVCGYSLPDYDTQVLRLLNDGAAGRPLQIFLIDPNSDALIARWKHLAREANIVSLLGLPDGLQGLKDPLAKL